jgi:DNA invertase Pin-like site-specific DNA recombinase
MQEIQTPPVFRILRDFLPTLQLRAKRIGDKLTGATADRPQLRKLVSALAAGDVVIIPAVDRLSRDTTDLLVIAREMQQAGAGIRSLAAPFLDTTSAFAEIVFAILGVPAKLERRRIPERTARGRADAKAQGVKFGRKPKLTQHQQREARARLEAGETQRSVGRNYNVDQSTISRLPVGGATSSFTPMPPAK